MEVACRTYGGNVKTEITNVDGKGSRWRLWAHGIIILQISGTGYRGVKCIHGQVVGSSENVHNEYWSFTKGQEFPEF